MKDTIGVQPTMAIRTKYYSIYPLYVLPRTSSVDPNVFFNCILINRIKENILKTNWRGEEIPYSMIGDRLDGGLIYGRLLRLNKDDVGRIDIDKFKEEVLTNGPSQYVEENSHFLFDTKNNLVFCEYNPNGVNALSKRSSEIFNNSIRKCGSAHPTINLSPIPSDDLIEALAGSGMIKRYRLQFPGVNAKHIEEFGGPSSLINEIAEEDRLEFDMTLKLERRTLFSSDKLSKLRELAGRLKNRKAKSFKIYTDEGNFDLIASNLLYYDAEVVRKSHIEMREDLFGQIRNLLENNSKKILEIIRKQPSLDKF